MKNHRKRTIPQAPKSGKARWLPTENTRPQTFADRRAVADKRACRGRITAD